MQLQNETQLARTAKVPTVRGVRKLRCGLQSLLVIRGARPHNLCAENILAFLESIGQQPPTASFSGSDYKSPLPLGISSLRTPLSRSRAPLQLSDAALVSR